MDVFANERGVVKLRLPFCEACECRCETYAVLRVQLSFVPQNAAETLDCFHVI